ncbi:MAG: transcription termination factor NusA [Dehalococcoidia bacterium]
MKTDFLLAITQLTAEKSLPEDVVFDAVEAALAAAYKRVHSIVGQVQVKIDRVDGNMRVWSEREVVEVEEDIADKDLQVDLDAARKHQPTLQIGDTLTIEHEVSESAGRIAAQTAKQVVLQRLREAERDVVFEEYSGREGEVVSGIIQRIESRQVIIDLGRTEAVLPVPEQIRMEHYRSGQRLRVYVLEVLKANKGPQVVVSRTHKDLLRRLFELEVPEVFKGLVEIKAIAREPGHRTKIAVFSRQEGLDPVGACVGMRGIRIQNIVNELQGERIDVIQWDPDPRKFVGNALSPAQVVATRIDPETNTAEIAVPDQQLSLAIGKEGQNARLAARLTRLRIDIKPQSIAEKLQEEGIGPYAPQPELAPAVVAEAPVPAAAAATEPAAAAVAEPETGIPAIAPDEARQRAQREGAPEAAPAEAEAEEVLEPALAGLEVGPAKPDAGKIRFAEDVLRRPVEEPEPTKKRRRTRYVETDEGLDEDPYVDFENQFEEE